MSSSTKPSAVTTVAPDQGQTVSVVGDTYRIVISGEQTGGAFAVIDMLVPPGGGPGPHSHAAIEESFYVAQGEVVVATEKGASIARAGAYVLIPLGGAVHSFHNKSDRVAHLLCTVRPAGLEAFFAQIGQPVKPGEFLPQPGPDSPVLKRMLELAPQYGQKLYPPDYLG